MRPYDFHFPHIGSVSHGTLRPEDLIPTYVDVLSDVLEHAGLFTPAGLEVETARRIGHAQEMLGDIERRAENGGEDYFESEAVVWDIETLSDLLNDFAPELHYFGAHEGDGSDIGYWPMEYDC